MLYTYYTLVLDVIYLVSLGECLMRILQIFIFKTCVHLTDAWLFHEALYYNSILSHCNLHSDLLLILYLYIDRLVGAGISVRYTPQL